MSKENKGHLYYKCNVCGDKFSTLEGCKKHAKDEHYATANPGKCCDAIVVKDEDE